MLTLLHPMLNKKLMSKRAIGLSLNSVCVPRKKKMVFVVLGVQKNKTRKRKENI